MLRFSFGLHVFFARVCGLLVGGLECQCLVFALVLIVNGFASSVFLSIRVSCGFGPSRVARRGMIINTGSNFGS